MNLEFRIEFENADRIWNLRSNLNSTDSELTNFKIQTRLFSGVAHTSDVKYSLI